MFLLHNRTGDRVEVLDTASLFTPYMGKVHGRLHAGEEMQEPEDFDKTDLVFLSGEHLPACWTDVHYREH